MKPYSFSVEELKIISELQRNGIPSEKIWSDESLTNIKSNLKDHYIKEQNKICAYCRVELHTNHHGVWDAEHIIDKDSSPQWMFEPLNLCVSCKDCNQAKGIKPVTKSESYKNFPNRKDNYKVVHAHFDKYEDHIKVAVPGVTYRYITPKGRYTIEICGLLRYHEIAGRNDIDPILQAVLTHAADKQTPEALKAALEYLSNHIHGHGDSEE